MKVLFLSEWYPHRYDAMAGLFVQKHAMAVAGQGVDVCVLYLHHDTRIRHAERTDITHDGIREITVYYPNRYLSALRNGWRYVRTPWGCPDICQLNVITKNALLPLWLKLKHKTPYIIVEHWSGYQSDNGQYAHSSWLHRRLAQTAAKHASQVLTVSDQLTASMLACGLQNPHYEHINNVVDDFFFEPSAISRTHSDKKSLLHVSCFDESAKNVCGLLRAVRAVADRRTDFTLTIVGVGIDYEQVRAYADSLNFPKDILRWTGELQPPQVAEEFDKADAFVLFSNYETAGVVLCESVACGKPIISTPVGIAPLIVNDKTGILVPIGDEQALAQAVNTMLDTYGDYDSHIIRTYAEQYRFSSVGQRLIDFYQHALCTTSS